MSELINTHDNRATIRWKLLTGASAMALTAYVASSSMAAAGDREHPILWLEMGGQMEAIEGLSAPVTAPFMLLTPPSDIYKGISFDGSQRVARLSFGEEASITFQPEDSPWFFSAGIRYGRSHSRQHKHNQLSAPAVQFHYVASFYENVVKSSVVTKIFTNYSELADTNSRSSEDHFILDFTAGKDVGLGLFGHQGSSAINAGLRIASFRANSTTGITARPEIDSNTFYGTFYYGYFRKNFIKPDFHQYVMTADAARSFMGFGPTLSWSASAAIAGNEQDGELMLDWGVNAAIMFGKQKAKVNHNTRGYHYHAVSKYNVGYPLTYQNPKHSTRSRSVTVPNIGGFAGLSLKWPNAKLSIGYRYDTFLNAMDTGIDARKTSNLTFNGPYASISIGLGD